MLLCYGLLFFGLFQSTIFASKNIEAEIASKYFTARTLQKLKLVDKSFLDVDEVFTEISQMTGLFENKQTNEIQFETKEKTWSQIELIEQFQEISCEGYEDQITTALIEKNWDYLFLPIVPRLQEEDLEPLLVLDLQKHAGVVLDFLDAVAKIIDVHKSDKHGLPSLYRAVMYNCINGVEILLKRGAIKVKGTCLLKHVSFVTCSFGCTAVYCAAARNQVSIIEILLEHGAKIDDTNLRLQNSFLSAASSGNCDLVTVLLKAGVNPNLRFFSMIDGATALHCSSGYPIFKSHFKNHIESHPCVINILLTLGADPNLTGPRLQTPIMLAAESGSCESVKLLLNAQANPNLQDLDERTALHHAALSNNPCVTEILLRWGVNPNLRDNHHTTPLHLAELLKNSSVIEMYLHCKVEMGGADLDLRDLEGKTTLHHGAIQNHPSVIEFLLNNGTEIDATDNQPHTPLIRSVISSFLRVLNFILIAFNLKPSDQPVRYRYRVDRIDFHENTALHHAAMNNHPSVMDILLKHGAAVDKTNNQSQSPLLLAAKLNNCHCVKRLFQRANPILKDDQGKTALEYARSNNCEMCITYLEFTENATWWRKKIWQLVSYVAVIDIIALAYYVAWE